jgi:hypothetical protein
MEFVIGIQDIRWLREVSYTKRAEPVPDIAAVRLIKLGLTERTDEGVVLTSKGRIALERLG